MKSAMPLFVVLAMAFGFVMWAASANTAQTQTPMQVGGYTCRGEDRGRDYTLYLHVQPYGKTYQFGWQDSPSSEPYMMGLGVQDGSVVAIALVDLTTRAVGTALYHIGQGTLGGIWTRGDGSVSTEACKAGTDPKDA